MLFLEFFANFLHERFLELWLGQGKRYRQTDGRTDGHTRREKQTLYVSRRGRHITREESDFFCRCGTLHGTQLRPRAHSVRGPHGARHVGGLQCATGSLPRAQ